MKVELLDKLQLLIESIHKFQNELLELLRKQLDDERLCEIAPVSTIENPSLKMNLPPALTVNDVSSIVGINKVYNLCHSKVFLCRSCNIGLLSHYNKTFR